MTPGTYEWARQQLANANGVRRAAWAMSGTYLRPGPGNAYVTKDGGAFTYIENSDDWAATDWKIVLGRC